MGGERDTGPAEVTAALAGTRLEGLPVKHGPQGAAVVEAIPPASVLTAWQEACALVPVTGRWPVVVTGEFEGSWARSDPEPAPSEAELAALDEAARTLDPWSAWPLFDDTEISLEDPERSVAGFLAAGMSGTGLSEADVRRLPSPITEHDLERLVYDRVRSDPAWEARVRIEAHHHMTSAFWYTPADVSLLLLPTTSAWLAPQWVHFFGALGESKELAAALWQWQSRWDARLFASWGTMLQFVVHRPPEPGEDAWELAGQFKRLACYLSMTRWEVATVLPSAGTWFVHCRP
ncbi:DUF4253 domain-containing protein [Spirilliplanes yamanashiensis]|uniref:DUF4253 domain-containing protein n=1 Tax=Spirilliplanes yamanashiensis TaxID=42233 RepID=A0A8J3Y492_9ACTN|nr:DUF4253 domain-containing protein [Spirilliplanes yamanashiensis]MDP9819974.1 hypothetical protein [Spirilliplanes yamanashiensis]GIJ01207.1 hypothetical protein Sya03_05590 [Spirilliplanes yamanashiensis]